jgi:hypothetical protein
MPRRLAAIVAHGVATPKKRTAMSMPRPSRIANAESLVDCPLHVSLIPVIYEA